MPSSIDLGRLDATTIPVITIAATTTAPAIQASVAHWIDEPGALEAAKTTATGQEVTF
jgi:hypothetical protein